jgi:hypothetical protein
MTEQKKPPQASGRMSSKLRVFPALAVGGAVALLLIGCEGATGPAGPVGPPGTGIVGTFEYFVQVDSDADNFSDTVVAVDPISFTVNRIGTPDVGEDSTASLTNTHKTQFYQGNRWIGGTDLWAFDPVTFAVVPRVAAPGQFIQANREGTVGPGQVNTKAASSAALASLPKNLADYIGRTQLTKEEAAAVNMCDVQTLATTALASTKAPADTLAHSIGYSPVGFELTPDGNMGVSGVRLGDHILILDTDPASPTFRQPLRFIAQRYGQIKDASNNVVATFPGVYTPAGGTAPGRLNYNRAGSATGGETVTDTFVEPCDTTLLRDVNGQVWIWTPDVDGDTITGARVDSITTATPTVVQVAVPHLDASGGTGATSGLKRVGPWMASLQNRAADGAMIFSTENEGENSESLFNVSDPANIVEIQRMVPDLATMNGPVAASMIGTPGLAGQFAAGQVIPVGVDFSTTGGARQSVNYIYRQVAGAGDNGSGQPPGAGPAPSNPPLTTAYLEKQTASDPGPLFIVNGLAGRGGTTEGNFATTIGTGTDTMVFSDRIWILTFVAGPFGNFDIFQIVDLSTAPPWRITENVEFPSSFGGMIGPDNKLVQVRNGNLEIIDISESPHSRKTVTLFHPTAGVLMNARTLSLRYLP